MIQPRSTPDTMSVTLSWGDNQSVTLTSDTTSEHGSVTKVSENQWDYEFQSIPKYDDTKSAYTYTVTPEADGYSFSKLGDSDYDFSCAPADASAETTASTSAESLNIHPLDSGILDEDVSSSLSGTSDNLVTSSIPSSDRVVAGTDSDPTNANQDEKAASGQRSIYENETGYVSTPIFYLGNKNKLEIEIMNYDVPRPQPDANYFSLGVKVTSMQTGTTAFLSGDINNYNGTETELAKKLGHVNLLKLGHHGSYGSNTDGYIRSLNPDMAILTGTYTYVTNTTINGECGTRDTLLAMGERGTPLYATGWYAGIQSALVIHLNPSLDNNISSGRSLVAIGNIDGSTVAVYYENGFPTVCSGWKKDNYGNYYYFQNSSTPLTNQFVEDNNAWYYVNASGQRTTGWVYVTAVITIWTLLPVPWSQDGFSLIISGIILGQMVLCTPVHIPSMVPNILSILTDLWSHLPGLEINITELMAYGFHITKTKTGEKIPMVTGISVLMVLTLSVSGKVSMGIGTISMPVDI